jgi:phosphoribosylformimino-5-aminoimidazole carboxamide ribotide isomerase
MIIIPAIDLKDGKCVRLLQGQKDKETVYSEDPIAMAEQWADYGINLLHIVDLDGAFSGTQSNFPIIQAIKRDVRVEIEVGGGIRDLATIEKLITLGVDRVIIGTMAVKNPDLFKEACKKFSGKIISGIDARNGKVAIKGWVEDTDKEAIEFGREMEQAGAAGVIYTDISRDGMLSGPNIEATSKIVENLSIPVIASGGISSLDDIKSLLTINKLFGAITGKALYTGSLDLKEAVELAARNE